MVTKLTAQGDNAVQDNRSSFDIETEDGKATIRPTTPIQLTGSVNFVIDTSSAGKADLSNVEVNFSGRSAYVGGVIILQHNRKIYRADYLQGTDSFAVSIPPGQATLSGDEITVSIEVFFDSVSGNIEVSSVSVGL